MSKRSIFLSYGARDKTIARRVESELERLGFDAFNPMRDLKPGDNWRKGVKSAIKSSDALVLLAASPQSVASSWVLYEAGMAEALGKLVMFLLPDKYPVDELPSEFAGWPILKFDPETPKRAAREIAERLVAA